jgi:hypothetical protein
MRIFIVVARGLQRELQQHVLYRLEDKRGDAPASAASSEGITDLVEICEPIYTT